MMDWDKSFFGKCTIKNTKFYKKCSKNHKKIEYLRKNKRQNVRYYFKIQMSDFALDFDFFMNIRKDFSYIVRTNISRWVV